MGFAEGSEMGRDDREIDHAPVMADVSELLSAETSKNEQEERVFAAQEEADEELEKLERDPAAAAETQRIIKLIEERRELRRRADLIRQFALQLALDYGVLEEFPDLKLWESDGLKKGLVVKPSPDFQATRTEDPESVRRQIQGKMDEADTFDQKCDALTAEIIPKD